MNIKNFNFRIFITNLIVDLLYPILKAVSSKNSLLAFSDACFIIAMIMALIGIAYALYLHGDFDITGYIASRSLNKEKKDFDVYMEDQKTKRKDSFNYPLLCAIILFLLSYLSALFV